MQTILGANGVIGINIAKTLPQFTNQIRLVSRNPKKVNETDEVFSADLLNAAQISEAVKGSEVVYLCAGLPYKIQVWQQQWPVIMNNVIEACKKHNSKLVFYDNVYSYGKVNGWMTEETPYNPCSKKGEVRAKIATQLMDETKKGNIEAMIVRGADFYGPQTPLGFVTVMVFENYAKGKKAQLMISDKTKHSYTYTPDSGKATALLGNTSSAFNQIWHSPCDKNVLTGKEFVELAAKAFGVQPKYTVLPKWMIWMAGLFNSNIASAVEMLYQNEVDYLFSSEKFEKVFPAFEITSYKNGITEVIKDIGKK
jgi:nucleoside-diphosphate-sugar epimerase